MSLQDARIMFNNADYNPDDINAKGQNAQSATSAVDWKYNPNNYVPEKEIDDMDENTAPAQTQPAQEQTTAETTQAQTAQEQTQTTQTTQAQTTQATQTTQAQEQERRLFEAIAQLSKNYDKDENIPTPERIGIFVRGFINILGGKAGVGKSWQVIRWMRDLSIGGNVFGGVATAQPPRKCLLFAGELPKKEMERRCRLLERGDGIERNYNNFVIVDNKEAEKIGLPLTLDKRRGQEAVKQFIKYHNPEIIFFDSLISYFEGDEKNSRDVNPVLEFLERLADEYNIAVVLIHHIRKRLSREQVNPLDQDDFIGSNALNRKSGFLFSAEYLYSSKKIITRELKSWLKKIKPFTYTLNNGLYGGLVMDIQPNAEDFTNQTENSKGKAQDVDPKDAWKKILYAFLRGKGQAGATISEIMGVLGRDKEKGENTTKTQLRRLVQTGELENHERGLYRMKVEELPVTDNETNTNNEIEINFTDETDE